MLWALAVKMVVCTSFLVMGTHGMLSRCGSVGHLLVGSRVVGGQVGIFPAGLHICWCVDIAGSLPLPRCIGGDVLSVATHPFH